MFIKLNNYHFYKYKTFSKLKDFQIGYNRFKNFIKNFKTIKKNLSKPIKTNRKSKISSRISFKCC